MTAKWYARCGHWEFHCGLKPRDCLFPVHKELRNLLQSTHWLSHWGHHLFCEYFCCGWMKEAVYVDKHNGKISLSQFWIVLIRPSQTNKKNNYEKHTIWSASFKSGHTPLYGQKITNINECSLSTRDYDIHNLPSEDTEKHGCFSTFPIYTSKFKHSYFSITLSQTLLGKMILINYILYLSRKYQHLREISLSPLPYL